MQRKDDYIRNTDNSIHWFFNLIYEMLEQKNNIQMVQPLLVSEHEGQIK